MSDRNAWEIADGALVVTPHYWNYSGRDAALMIRTIDGNPFHRLYLSVADADAACRCIRDAAGLPRTGDRRAALAHG